MAITMQSDCLQEYWKDAKQACRPCSKPGTTYQELLCPCEADKDAVIICTPGSSNALACRSHADALAECSRRGYTTTTLSTKTTTLTTFISSSSSTSSSNSSSTSSSPDVASSVASTVSAPTSQQSNQSSSLSSSSPVIDGVADSLGLVVGLPVCLILGLVSIGVLCWYFCRRRRESKRSPAKEKTGGDEEAQLRRLNSNVSPHVQNGGTDHSNEHTEAGGSFLPANGSADVEANEDVIEHIDSEHVSESTGLLDYGSDDRNRPVPGDPITNDSSQPLPAAIYPNISSDEDAPGNRSIVESSSEAVDSRLPPGNTGEVNTGVNDRVTPGTEGAADIGLSNACSEATDDNEASEGSGLPDRGTGDRKFPSNGSSTGHADTTNDDSLNNDCASADSSRLLASDKTLPVPEENKDDFKQAPMESFRLPESLQSS